MEYTMHQYLKELHAANNIEQVINRLILLLKPIIEGVHQVFICACAIFTLWVKVDRL